MTDHHTMLEGYFQLMNANGAAHVYREAVRSGLLDALHDHPGPAEEAAERCGLAARPAALMLDVLEAMSLVQRDGDGYRLAPLAAALLGGAYRDLGDAYWQHLPTFLQTGEPVTRMDDVAQSETHYQVQATALAWMLAPAAEEAAAIVANDPDFHSVKDILDMGAGSALWGLTMAQRFPSSEVTAVDWPAVLKVAQSTAQRMGLAERLHLLPGNYHDIELPEQRFDLAVLANVTHLETESGNRHLLTRARRALRPGGRILIVDVFPSQPGGQLNGTLYALGLALRTDHGRVHSAQDLEQLLASSGFTAIEHRPLQIPPQAVGMILARRSP